MTIEWKTDDETTVLHFRRLFYCVQMRVLSRLLAEQNTGRLPHFAPMLQ